MDLILFFGYVFLIYVFFKTFLTIWQITYPYWIAKLLKLAPKNLVEFCGARWAVITGSTEGIGKAYAKELAKRGFDLILIYRNPQKLEATKLEIKKAAPNVEIRAIKFDFVETDLRCYEKLQQQLCETDVGLLVNNVGIATGRSFHELQRIECTNILAVNTYSVTLLVRAWARRREMVDTVEVFHTTTHHDKKM